MVDETKYDYAIKYLDELKEALSHLRKDVQTNEHVYMQKVVTWVDIVTLIELMRAKITGDMILDKTNMLKENQGNGIKSR